MILSQSTIDIQPCELVNNELASLINCSTNSARKYVGKCLISTWRKATQWLNENCAKGGSKFKLALNIYHRLTREETSIHFKKMKAKVKRMLKKYK